MVPPVLVRSLKLSIAGPGQYLDGGPPGNTRLAAWFSCFGSSRTISGGSARPRRSLWHEKASREKKNFSSEKFISAESDATRPGDFENLGLVASDSGLINFSTEKKFFFPGNRSVGCSGSVRAGTCPDRPRAGSDRVWWCLVKASSR